MYLSNELGRVVIIGIIVYFAYKAYNLTHPKIESIEADIELQKKRLFDSTDGFKDLADSEMKDLEIMERHYFRLKQRFSSDKKKMLEIAKDWLKYVEVINDLKFASIILDSDSSDDALNNYDDNTKEIFIIKDEIQKKFKSLLGKDWEELFSEKLRRAFEEKAKKEKKGTKK